MKISILIPCKGRETVTAVTKPHILDHIQHAACYGIELIPHWTHEDVQLGRKLNNAMQALRWTDWDYVMIMGSDDLMRPQIWGYVRTAIEEGLQAFGFNEAILYDRLERRAKEWCYGPLTFGAGRCISRAIVTGCDWMMWDDGKENGIDNNQERRIDQLTGEYIHIIPTQFPVICDIKDGDNLNSYDDIEGGDLSPRHIEKRFPDLLKFTHAIHT
jgi:hypothetical protein